MATTRPAPRANFRRGQEVDRAHVVSRAALSRPILAPARHVSGRNEWSSVKFVPLHDAVCSDDGDEIASITTIARLHAGGLRLARTDTHVPPRCGARAAVPWDARGAAMKSQVE